MTTKEDRQNDRLKKNDFRLKRLVALYDDLYFKDCRFELKELKEKFLKYKMMKDGKEVDCYRETDFDVVTAYIFFYAKLPENTDGDCDRKKREIRLNKKNAVNKKLTQITILHEMIHGYEFLLSETHKQYLILFLYQKLVKRLGKRNLDHFIRMDQHLLLMEHSLFFLLKSLTIDLARRFPLGAIYSYGREKMFKRGNRNKSN